MGVKRWLAGGIAALGLSPAVWAHCPVCTAATGAAVGVARVYGVDDGMVGGLIGGFAVSSGLWIDNALRRRKIAYPGQTAGLLALSVGLTIVGLKTGGLLSGPSLWGLPRLLSGTLLGSVVTVGAHGVHEALRAWNDGKNAIAFQGVSVMLAGLLLLSLAFAGGLV